MEFKEIYALNTYELSVHEKENIILPYLNKLVCHHYINSEEYHNIIDIVYGGELNADSISEIPFLPVRLFKEFVLKSVSNDRIIKTMTSSGTTGTRPSRIYLDKETAERQQKVMIKILSDYIGGKRLPMLIIDNKKVLRDRNMLAVRGAAILGFSMAGSKREFALNEDMSFNKEHCIEFLDTHRNEKILIFGFTSMIWQYLYKVFEEISPLLDSYIVEKDLWIKPEQRIRELSGANETIGTLILKFPDSNQMESIMKKIKEHIHIKVKEPVGNLMRGYNLSTMIDVFLQKLEGRAA